MVFGWGRKKTDEKEPQDEQNATITISDISKILLKHKEARKSQILQQSRPRIETIKKEIQSIRSIMEHLKSDDLKLDDVDHRLKVIVVRGKTEVVETVLKEAAAELPKIDSYESLTKCADLLSHIIKKIGDVLGKNTRVIHLFAKKYAQDLKMHLETIATNHSEIANQLGAVAKLESTESSIMEKIGGLESLEEEISEKTSHLSKSNESLQRHIGTISELEGKISALKASPEYDRFQKSKQHLERLEDEGSKIDKEIDDEFSKISRPLGKYVYVTSLEKPLKAVLESLIQSPSRTIASEAKDAIVTVLESCMKGVVSGTVSVKETERTVEQIAHLISTLDTLAEKKKSHLLKVSQTRESLASFDSDQPADLEKQLKGAVADRDNAESRIKELESELKQNRNKTDDVLRQIESLVESAVGKRYHISR